jgi:osmotically inducible protein OsmC
MKRTASANWQGTGKDGKGTVSTQSGVLSNTAYSYKSRFEEGIGTNPEELIGAAHAGCYTMKLSFLLSGAGFTPENIDTKATVTLDNGAVTSSHLEVTVKAAGLEQDKFAELAEDAKNNCPISKLLNAEITLDAKLA